jgi:hypothetical protein
MGKRASPPSYSIRSEETLISRCNIIVSLQCSSEIIVKDSEDRAIFRQDDQYLTIVDN